MTVIGNGAYDTGAIPDRLTDVGATIVIPSRGSRAEPRTFDHAVYATRNLVDRVFGGIKEYRRVDTRCNQRIRSFPSPVFPDTASCLIRGLARATI